MNRPFFWPRKVFFRATDFWRNRCTPSFLPHLPPINSPPGLLPTALTRPVDSLGDPLESDDHVVEVHEQRLVGGSESTRRHVLQNDNVTERTLVGVVAIVVAAKVHSVRRQAGRRSAARQRRHDPFVEQYLVAELLVVLEERPELEHAVLELEHQPVPDRVAAVLAGNSQRAIQHGGRELIVIAVQPVRLERREPKARPERSGLDHSRHGQHGEQLVRHRLTDVSVTNRVRFR